MRLIRFAKGNWSMNQREGLLAMCPLCGRETAAPTLFCEVSTVNDLALGGAVGVFEGEDVGAVGRTIR